MSADTMLLIGTFLVGAVAGGGICIVWVIHCMPRRPSPDQ